MEKDEVRETLSGRLVLTYKKYNNTVLLLITRLQMLRIGNKISALQTTWLTKAAQYAISYYVLSNMYQSVSNCILYSYFLYYELYKSKYLYCVSIEERMHFTSISGTYYL